MTAAILAPHTGRRRKPLRRSVARAIWCWVTRHRAARHLDAALEAAAAPVYGPETLAQAAQRERGFDPIHPAPPPLLAARLELAAVKGAMAGSEPEPGWTQEQWDRPDLWQPGLLGEPVWFGPSRAPMWVPLQPHNGPVPAAMADAADDPGLPHLAAGQLGHTGQFAAVIDAVKGER